MFNILLFTTKLMNEQLGGFGETAVNAAFVLGFSDSDWYLCTVYVDVMEIIKKRLTVSTWCIILRKFYHSVGFSSVLGEK